MVQDAAASVLTVVAAEADVAAAADKRDAAVARRNTRCIATLLRGPGGRLLPDRRTRSPTTRSYGDVP